MILVDIPKDDCQLSGIIHWSFSTVFFRCQRLQTMSHIPELWLLIKAFSSDFSNFHKFRILEDEIPRMLRRIHMYPWLRIYNTAFQMPFELMVAMQTTPVVNSSLVRSMNFVIFPFSSHQIHSKVRHNQEMATHSLQCLSQLASLNGPVLPNQEACSKYLSNYLTNFLHFIQKYANHTTELIYHWVTYTYPQLMLCSCEGLQEQEALGVATIILHLTTFYSTRLFASLPEDLVVTFLQSLAAITSMFCQAAAKEESVSFHSYP